MAVLMLFACHYPRSRIYIFWVIPLEMRWLVLLYVIFDLHPVLMALAGEPQMTGVANAAHLGGLGFGFLYWRYSWRLEPIVDPVLSWLARPRGFTGRRRPPLRLHNPEPSPETSDAFQNRVDDILRKVHQYGRDSLTGEEQAVLDEASRRARQRPRR